MKGISSEPVSGPMSSAGIMRFFDVSGGGPKIKPMVVIGICLGLIVIEVIASAIF
jgi:preprotein translocase subunit Sec61beta